MKFEWTMDRITELLFHSTLALGLHSEEWAWEEYAAENDGCSFAEAIQGMLLGDSSPPLHEVEAKIKQMWPAIMSLRDQLLTYRSEVVDYYGVSSLMKGLTISQREELQTLYSELDQELDEERSRKESLKRAARFKLESKFHTRRVTEEDINEYLGDLQQLKETREEQEQGEFSPKESAQKERSLIHDRRKLEMQEKRHLEQEEARARKEEYLTYDPRKFRTDMQDIADGVIDGPPRQTHQDEEDRAKTRGLLKVTTLGPINFGHPVALPLKDIVSFVNTSIFSADPNMLLSVLSIEDRVHFRNQVDLYPEEIKSLLDPRFSPPTRRHYATFEVYRIGKETPEEGVRGSKVWFHEACLTIPEIRAILFGNGLSK